MNASATEAGTDLLARGRRGDSLAGVGIIDMHAHLHVGWGVPGDTGADAIVASMDRAGIAKTLITPSAPVSAADQRRENDNVLKALRAYPERLMGYIRLWPTAEPVSHAQAEARIAEGFTGVKILSTLGVPFTHPSYEVFVAVANEQRRPVLFHTWGQEAELSGVRELAARYPEASLLAGHAGSANEEAYIELARDCENVYLELTLSFSPRGLVDRFVAAVGAGKVVWGSDTALFSQAQQLGKVFGACISDQEKMQILSGNANGILGRIRT
ncbi:MAG: amidohydrolase family protein [Candidatus Hydrogenedentes bacterium]|nr:amidohydrolase family protein [Candidatus Hydrogenedentota bacterium]